MPPTHPVADPRPRTLMILAAAASRLPANRAWAIVLGIVTAAGTADIAIANGATMSVFYAGAIVFAAWFLGRSAGFATVAAVVALSCAARYGHAAGAPAGTRLTLAGLWNLGMNTFGALMLVVLAASLRAVIDHERARASTDPLTGVLNRGAFFERLAAIAAGPRDPALLLACIDLDGFKAINDARGHAAGDRLLVAFASGVVAALGESEAIARIGGDEFAMLVSLAPGEDATQRARRLHRHLGETLAHAPHPVTCSVGVTPIPAGRSLDGGALLAVADAAMYEIKRSGRDGILLVGDHAPPDEASMSLRLVRSDAV